MQDGALFVGQHDGKPKHQAPLRTRGAGDSVRIQPNIETGYSHVSGVE
jgi:hypothetical protein